MERIRMQRGDRARRVRICVRNARGAPLTGAGAEFVRVTWPQLEDLAALGRRVDAAIERWTRRCA